MPRLLWPLLLLAVSTRSAALPSVPVVPSNRRTVEKREQQVLRALARRAQFEAVPHGNGRPRCEQNQPPEPIATPDPLLSPFGRNQRVRVSFIVGTDGRIHSPLILQSAGASGDRRVLQTVRTWRYRPAMCNGVPTESEGKVEFSTH